MCRVIQSLIPSHGSVASGPAGFPCCLGGDGHHLLSNNSNSQSSSATAAGGLTSICSCSTSQQQRTRHSPFGASIVTNTAGGPEGQGCMHCSSRRLANAFLGRSLVNSGELKKVQFQASSEPKQKCSSEEIFKNPFKKILSSKNC